MIFLLKRNWLYFIINAQFMKPPPVWVLCNFIKLLDLEWSNKKEQIDPKEKLLKVILIESDSISWTWGSTTGINSKFLIIR